MCVGVSVGVRGCVCESLGVFVHSNLIFDALNIQFDL
jgi:hypothetical protein